MVFESTVSMVVNPAIKKRLPGVWSIHCMYTLAWLALSHNLEAANYSQTPGAHMYWKGEVTKVKNWDVARVHGQKAILLSTVFRPSPFSCTVASSVLMTCAPSPAAANNAAASSSPLVSLSCWSSSLSDSSLPSAWNMRWGVPSLIFVCLGSLNRQDHLHVILCAISHLWA